MHSYVAGALAIFLIAMGPAAAIDLGQSGATGSNLGAGHKETGLGKNLGISANVGNKESGRKGKGNSVAKTGKHIGGSKGKTDHSKSARAGSKHKALATATAAAPSKPRDQRAKIAAPAVAVAPNIDTPTAIALPALLRPIGRGGDWRAPLEAVRGAPDPVVQACREAIESAATSFGVVSVRARSAGFRRHLSRGRVSAPVHVRIDYQRRGGIEIRQARIQCQLDARGRVLKLT